MTGRSRFEAAITRTSHSISPLPPTRVNRRSCSTRSRVACNGMGIDAISSRKRVPRSASSKRPSRRRWAPVKDPFSWPKSSLSMSVSGMAAQLTATKGRSALRLERWRVRATSSLPVPDSPTTSTVASVPPTFSIVRYRALIGRERPINSPKPSPSRTASRSSRFSLSKRRVRSTRCTASSRASRSKGLPR